MTLDTLVSIIETGLLCACTYVKVIMAVVDWWRKRDFDSSAWVVVDVFLMATVNQQFYQEVTAPTVLASSSAVRGAVLLYFVSGIIAKVKARALRRAER